MLIYLTIHLFIHSLIQSFIHCELIAGKSIASANYYTVDIQVHYYTMIFKIKQSIEGKISVIIIKLASKTFDRNDRRRRFNTVK